MTAFRKPTGEQPFPLILLEGGEASGKSYSAISLSADERIGSAFVIEVGERWADAYQSLGSFLVADHDGQPRSIAAAIREATEQPFTEGRTNLIVVDSATMLWEKYTRRANWLATQSKAAKAKLEADPYAEIDAGHPQWNKVKDEWWESINLLREWPGIVLLVARTDVVSKFKDGKPVPNQWERSIQIEKGTPFACTAQVGFNHPQPPVLAWARGLATGELRDVRLPVEAPLAHLCFELLDAGRPATFPAAIVKARLKDAAKAKGLPEAEARQACSDVWRDANLNGAERVPVASLAMLIDALPVPATAPDAEVTA